MKKSRYIDRYKTFSRLITIIAIIFGFSEFAKGETMKQSHSKNEKAMEKMEQKEDKKSLLNKNAMEKNQTDNEETKPTESWYTMWNYSPLASINVFGGIHQDQDQEVFEYTFFGLDLLGFYWPMFKPGLIVGGVLNYLHNFDLGGGFTTTTLEVQNYNASALYFFNGEVGQGFFIRGDLGVRFTKYRHEPKAWKRKSGTTVPPSSPPVYKNDTGLNMALGVGSRLHIFKKTKILSQVVCSMNPIGDINVLACQCLIGFLF